MHLHYGDLIKKKKRSKVGWWIFSIFFSNFHSILYYYFFFLVRKFLSVVFRVIPDMIEKTLERRRRNIFSGVCFRLLDCLSLLFLSSHSLTLFFPTLLLISGR